MHDQLRKQFSNEYKKKNKISFASIVQLKTMKWEGSEETKKLKNYAVKY